MKKSAVSSGNAKRAPLIGKLVILGVGLIGGSFALALKRHQAVAHVIGVGRTRANLVAARRLGVIDEIATDPAQALKGADLVLLAVPLGQTAAVLAKIAPYLEPQTVVTDAGSAKRAVVTHAQRILGSAFARFVPAHPIAGTEKSGARAAFAELYEGRNLIVTPAPQTNARALRLVTAAWKLAGMKICTMNPDEHDRVFALVSHLPHMLSFALVDQIAGYKDAGALFGYTGSGFRDTVRIAGSSPEMWRDICVTNRTALLAAIDDYVRELKGLRDLIKARNSSAVEARFAMARAARAKWLLPH